MAKDKKNIIIDIEQFIENKKTIIDVSPSANAALSGGIPTGTWGIISGKYKQGKTSLAIHLLAKFFEKFPDRKALYVDVETRLKPELNLQHILFNKERLSNLKLLRSSADNILSAEDFLTETENFIKTNYGCLVIIDSISALCSASEYTDEIKGTTRSLGPKILASFCRKMAPIIPIQDSIVVMLTHLIANTSGYGSPFNEDGGNKIQYQSDWKLRCKKSDHWTEGEKNIGKIIDWSVEWSALGPPGTTFQSYFRYNYGIDEVIELILIGEELGLITKGGAWYTCLYLPNTPKYQGLNNLANFIKSNIQYVNLLKQAIKQELEVTP